MKVYVTLPISGHNLYDQQKLAKQVKKELEEAGYTVITPFDVVQEKDKPYNYCMGKDIEALLSCDAICMCSGHETSKGCQLELSAALIYEKYIIYSKTKI